MPKITPFEKYSDAYDKWFDRHPEFFSAELKALRELLPPVGAEGLEIGVGTSRFALPLGIGIGVEPSENMTSKA